MIDFKNLIIPISNIKKDNNDKDDTFDINNSRLLPNDYLVNNSIFKENKSIEKSKILWDHNQLKKLRLTNSAQCSKKSLNLYPESGDIKAKDKLFLISSNFNPIKPKDDIKIKLNKKVTFFDINNNNFQKDNKENINKKCILIDDDNKNIKKLINSRNSSEESNLMIDNIININSNIDINENNKEVIHFNCDENEKKIENINSIKNIERNNKIININKNKSKNITKNKTKNISKMKVENTDIEINKIGEKENLIKNNNKDEITLNRKISKSRKKILEKSIKDVSLSQGINNK